MSTEKKESTNTVRTYEHKFSLKYGCNPHQLPANIHSIAGKELPFTTLNGSPGYINILDALNAWQLVHELSHATGLAAAASFKHVSPAGAAVAVPLSDTLKEVYGIAADAELTDPAIAYIRARNADPKSSFGDFVALSSVVDEKTALFLKTEVSDGIIAAGYEPKALEILASKKSGKYIVLKANVDYEPPQQEFRELYGCVFEQRRNDIKITADLFKNVVTDKKEVPEAALRDMIIASIAIKYTQSNSVGYAVDGQMVGIGAGQQSRVDCVKLAGSKADIWFLRQHPKVMKLKFAADKKLNKVAKINARIRYIEGDFTEPEYKEWLENFDQDSIPEPLTLEEKAAFLKKMDGVTISSDAFFPFRDNIDQASKRGVKYVAQPGGSVQDDVVTKAANEYGMTMVFTNTRLFQH